MHGSGGAGGNIGYWQRQLHPLGISTFVVDGITGRGFTGVGSNQASLGRLNFIVDMYRALASCEASARRPRAHRTRGFSRGGQGVLYASVERFHQLWNECRVQPAAYVAFYPDCATTYREDTAVAPKPIRIFHGTPDNYNPVSTCKAFVNRLKEAKADVELTDIRRPNTASTTRSRRTRRAPRRTTNRSANARSARARTACL